MTDFWDLTFHKLLWTHTIQKKTDKSYQTQRKFENQMNVDSIDFEAFFIIIKYKWYVFIRFYSKKI